MNTLPAPYEIYQHFKGKLYQIITIAKDSETLQPLVVYQQLYSPFEVYVRPLEMFLSKVDRSKYPDIKQEYRFSKVTIDYEQKINREVEAVAEVNQNHEEKQSESQENFYDVEDVLDPLLLEFLDSDTYEKKLNILVALENRITNEMINTMAIAMDVEVEEGSLMERYDSLRNCIYTLQRYECNRLR